MCVQVCISLCLCVCEPGCVYGRVFGVWMNMCICVCEFMCIFVFGGVCVQKMVSDKPRQASWARALDDASPTVGPAGSVFSGESGDRRASLEF